MWLLTISVCTLALQLNALQFIDLPLPIHDNTAAESEGYLEPNVQRRLMPHNLPSENSKELRRNWIHHRQGNTETTQSNEPNTQTPNPKLKNHPPDNYNKNLPADNKDETLKAKISTLVLQTMHDTERRTKSVSFLREKFINKPPYKIGFILCLIKGSRDVMNELFNVAVKHREKWKALEELKIFELIVHTNVDTTNLVRRLVEEHVNFLNSTNPDSHRQRLLML